jgi:hypothetical protein
MRRTRTKTKIEDPVTVASNKFEQARTDLHDFLDENQGFYEKFEELVEEYNVTRQEAEASLKKRLLQSDKKTDCCPGFKVSKISKDVWDGSHLIKLFGKRIANAFVTTTTVYKVDKKKLEQLIRQEEIDGDKARKAYQENPPVLKLAPGCPKAIIL